MNVFTLFPLMGGQAAGATGAATQGGAAGGLMSFLPFVLIIGIFYFLIIRPQNKKQKETQKMLAALKKGDKIVTICGIHGTISKVKEQTVVVDIGGKVDMEFSRSAISTVVTVAPAEDDESSDDKKQKKLTNKEETDTKTDAAAEGSAPVEDKNE